jgi:hypothetical protein
MDMYHTADAGAERPDPGILSTVTPERPSPLPPDAPPQPPDRPSPLPPDPVPPGQPSPLPPEPPTEPEPRQTGAARG